jgi:glyoxylase-like metal-dependent hydrolase (beta-lactamase superfamily II)
LILESLAEFFLMDIDVLPVGPLQTNCYLLTCRETREAVLIDPGWHDRSIRDAIVARQARVRFVLNTHAHFDHIGGNAAMIEETGAILAIHPAELPLLRAKGGADLFGFPMHPSPEPERLLTPDEVLEVGTLRLRVLFTPGHTPGHVSFYEEAHQAVFDGDVLFKRGVGRTDLPGGSQEQLMDSIRLVLFQLPDQVVVYPGHGPETTIGEERLSNPWLD